MRILPVLFAAGTLATSVPETASAQQLVQRRDVSYAVAFAIATGAVDACRALGFTSSAVVVVGRGGDTILAASDDDARPHAMEAARRKAYTARTFGITTTEFSKELPDRPARRAQVLLPHITSLDGGVPIKLGNEVIGGVGVAGSPGKDEQCATGGLDKVKAALQ
ncbi:MAG: GlcG/HbpS family heme-binding protein [Xanthobacteraceae bacterium]